MRSHLPVTAESSYVRATFSKSLGQNGIRITHLEDVFEQRLVVNYIFFTRDEVEQAGMLGVRD